MEIKPTTPPAGTAAKAPAAADADAETKAAAKADATAGPAGDFETFLTLLTTQLKNQDPLKPMESTEFVAQLASFSAVEQQVRTNDRLEQIYQALSGGGVNGLAQWIGKEVRAPGNGSFAGVPMDVEVTPNPEADRAFLVVRNDFDQIVARRPIDAQASTVTWDGQDDMGQTAANGSYGFAVESFKGETLLGTEPGLTFSRVSEVRLNDGAPVLVLDGGAQVPLDEVSGLR